jgi:hypothetical protein
MEKWQTNLGLPSIQLSGLQIWVHNRQSPEASDYWDGNWVNVTVHCGARGADVWATGPIIHLPEVRIWADACERMYQTLSCEASLACMEPELSIELRAEELGHISMRVSITPDHLTQQHMFQIEVDQSYLADLVDDCRKTLRQYPIKNESE